jgi:integrase/recombinase XerD
VVPSIAIFVRHTSDCKYQGDETCKRCNCRKHLRWSHDGKQYRRSAETRSWGQAEEQKRELERQFEEGGKPTAVAPDDRKTITRAVELFLLEQKTGGLNGGVLKKYERELGRLQNFLTPRSKFFPSEIDRESLIEYRATWDALYPSSQTRQMVQARLRRFLRFCYDSNWIDRIPELSSIKVTEPPTMPLSKAEYKKLLGQVPTTFEGVKAQRVRALIQLMRYSALAIRDAVTLERSELVRDAKRKTYRVATARQKTGTPVSVLLPPDIAAEVLAVLNGNPRFVFWNGNGLETSAVTNWQHDLRTLFRATFGKDTNFTPHCLRDTAAVEWLSAGIPLEEVSKWLGHSTIKTTEKSYAPWVTARQDRSDSLIVATWKDGANV